MRYITLRDLEVSRIGLGAMGMSHGYTGSGADDAESIRTVHRALELGVTLMDTAVLEASPGAERVLALLEERGWKGWTRIERVPTERLDELTPRPSPTHNLGQAVDEQ